MSICILCLDKPLNFMQVFLPGSHIRILLLAPSWRDMAMESAKSPQKVRERSCGTNTGPTTINTVLVSQESWDCFLLTRMFHKAVKSVRLQGVALTHLPGHVLTISIHFCIPQMWCGTSAEVQPSLIRLRNHIAKKSPGSSWTWWENMCFTDIGD